jgi:hypothetical protein
VTPIDIAGASPFVMEQVEFGVAILTFDSPCQVLMNLCNSAGFSTVL